MNNIHPYQSLPSRNYDESVGQECVSHWHCQGCGQLSPVESCNNGLDNGLELYGFAGYYGGFTDQVFSGDVDQYSATDNAYFCHDCCVKLFNTFPHLAKVLDFNNSIGHHSVRGDDSKQQPCCTNCWTSKSFPDKSSLIYVGQYDSNGDLVWVLRA